MLRRLSDLLAGFSGQAEAQGKRQFVEVCRRWTEIVGPETAELVQPLGQRRRELLLGTDDPVARQEMVFAAPEIVALVNKALGQDVFDKVRFDLIGDRVSLDALRAEAPRFRTPSVPRPAKLGELLGHLDTASPVARCYAKYVAYFDTGGPSSRSGRRRKKKARVDDR